MRQPPPRAGASLPRELRLPRALGSLHAIDLRLDGCHEPLPLGQLALDRALLRCAIGDHLRLPRAVGAELGTTRLHLVAEPAHVLQDLCVLSTDPLCHVEAIEEVVEALRAEDHLDRAGGVAVDVERAQTLGDVPLRSDEARPGDHEVPAVRLEVRVDLAELDVREVVRLRRMPELRIELLDLREDSLRLCPLRRDRRVRRGRPGDDQQERRKRRERQNEERAWSLRERRHATSRSPVDRPADGGVTGHKSGSLAASSDVCMLNRRENVCKQP